MKKASFFWVGYSDLMTSLFFIMLVLFIVSISYLQFQTKATKEQLAKLEEIQTAVTKLPAKYFVSDKQYKRHTLNREILFDKYKYDINPNDYQYLRDVGHSLINLVDSLNSNEKFKDLDIQYLIIIEGMSSKDNYTKNFELSYQRALELYKFWKNENIIFNPEFCEIQIAGSGTDGIRSADERKNQQFLIQIVPKIGEIVEKGEEK